MAAPKDVVRVCQHEHTITLLIDGWGTMSQSYAIRQLIETCLCHGLTTIRFDLRHCTYMDSTFLGTLLSLKKHIERRGAGALQLVSPSPESLQLLRKMSMDGLFTIVIEDEPAEGVVGELGHVCCDADTLRHNIVDVHRELANLPGPAGAPFRVMVQGLEREAKTRK